jgi:hypothetical protein
MVMVTKEQFESEREKLILEGSSHLNCLKTLGALEGLLEITDSIEESCLPSGYDHETHEKESLLTQSKRTYKKRILNIEAWESISSYNPNIYSLTLHLNLLNEIKDPRPCCEIPTLTLGPGGMNFSYLEKNVDDAITLLEIYKSAIQTEAYGKREKQLEPLRKDLKEKLGIVA